MPRTFKSLCILISLAVFAGCAQKKPELVQTPAAMLPLDRSVTQVTPSPQETPPTQDVLPSRDDSVAALIRKSEEYAREMNQGRASVPAESSVMMNQQITVKPAPSDPVQSQPPLVSNETKAVDISQTPTLRAPETTAANSSTAEVNANTAVPMTATHANIADAPVTARVVPQAAPVTPAFSSDVLEKKLLTRVKEYPRDVAGHLEFQMMQFLKDEPTPDLATLSALPEEDRELVAAVMDGLSNFRTQIRADNNMLLSKKIRPMVDLAARLQSQAELNLPTLSLCRRVEGFGRYEPIEPPRFGAGKDTDVIVYAEVANFTSRITGEKNLWQTDLTQDIVLYSEAGQPVWTDQTSQVQDTSRVRRHDFFVVKRVKLPASLPIGRYLFKVTITDRQANRVAEASLPLQIVAQ